MLAEMVINSAGLGDILNPTAGTSLDCGLFAGGVFKPACWCAAYPHLCGDISTPQQAAQAQAGIDSPGIYTAIPPAPGLPAVSGGTVYGNETVSQYDAEVAAAWEAWKSQVSTQNSDAMSQAAANIEAAGQPTASSIPAWIWVALAGVGAFALVAIGGGSPARYGR